MKNLIKTGLVLALLFITASLSAEIEIFSKLDASYNSVTNSLEFTLSLKAGTGYEPLTSNGDFTGINIRWNLYLESGVEVEDESLWTTDINGVGYFPLLIGNTIFVGPFTPAGAIGLAGAFGRNPYAAGNSNDLTDEYQIAAKISIPLTATSAVPTDATYISQRVMSGTVGDLVTNNLFSSTWSNIFGLVQQYIIPDADKYYFVEDDGECPPTATWLGTDSNWNNTANWNVGKIPGKCTYVTIPAGKSYYPVLTAGMNAKCGTIYFEFGGEVAHTCFLDYDDAKVDMAINDNRWYMVAAPLRDMYSGDYFLEDSYARLNPAVYMMQYQAENPETGVAKSQGSWSNPFNTLNVELPVASGFAVWVDQGEKASGKWTFTFPKDSTNYLYYDWGGQQTGKQVTDDLPGGMVRTKNTRFTYESATPVSGEFTTALTAEAPGYTSYIVGNPFMSHLDLNTFYNANKTEITNTFYLWSEDASFSAYKKVGEWFMIAGDNPLGVITPTSTVPPMQSFFVERINPAFAGVLNFAPDMETTLPGDVLKSSDGGELKENVLKLDVYRDDSFQSGIAIRYAADAQNGYAGEEDAWTLFPDRGIYSAILYSLIEGKAATINSLRDLSQDIELGIATLVKGPLKLVCRNVENFDANCDIFLIDRMGGMQNLRKNPVYEFTNATGNVEGRFTLRIVNNTNGIKNTEAGDISIYAQNGEIFVNGSRLQQVEVFNLQGQMIARKENINAGQSSILVPDGLPFVIVKVTGDRILNTKIAVR